MINGWSHLMMLFGSSLHRKPQLNTYLSLAQECFNSSSLGQRIAAFSAWRRLIMNLSFEGHLYHSKRVKLILLPILNCLKFEKSLAVRQGCFEAYVYLLYHVSHDVVIETVFEALIVPALAFEDSDPEIRLFGVFLDAIG